MQARVSLIIINWLQSCNVARCLIVALPRFRERGNCSQMNFKTASRQEFELCSRKKWPIKYALNTHMWYAIIVNKQMKNHQRSVQPENLKITTRKNVQEFPSEFQLIFRFQSIPRRFSFRSLLLFAHEKRFPPARNSSLYQATGTRDYMRGKFQSPYILMTTAELNFLRSAIADRAQKENFRRFYSEIRNCNSRRRKLCERNFFVMCSKLQNKRCENV